MLGTTTRKLRNIHRAVVGVESWSSAWEAVKAEIGGSLPTLFGFVAGLPAMIGTLVSDLSWVGAVVLTFTAFVAARQFVIQNRMSRQEVTGDNDPEMKETPLSQLAATHGRADQHEKLVGAAAQRVEPSGAALISLQGELSKMRLESEDSRRIVDNIALAQVALARAKAARSLAEQAPPYLSAEKARDKMSMAFQAHSVNHYINDVKRLALAWKMLEADRIDGFLNEAASEAAGASEEESVRNGVDGLAMVLARDHAATCAKLDKIAVYLSNQVAWAEGQQQMHATQLLEQLEASATSDGAVLVKAPRVG